MLDRYFKQFFQATRSLEGIVKLLKVKLYKVDEVKLFIKFSVKNTFENRLVNFWLGGASNYRQKFSATKLFTP